MGTYTDQSNTSAIVIIVVVAIASSLIIATTLPSLIPENNTTTTTTSSPEIPHFPPLENLTQHDPIYIESDLEFAAAADLENWPGIGSVYDPYIIQGYSFDSSETCIHIAYTNLHFIIRECAFTSNSSEFWTMGVNMWEADNGLVERCQFTDMEWGVNMFKSNNCVLVDSQMTTIGIAVNVSYSSNSAVIGNLVYNSSIGMLIDQSSNFNISGNVLMYNEYSMDYWYSTGGHITHNNVTDNVHGMNLAGVSSECMIMFNTLFNNEGIGLALCDYTSSVQVYGNLIGWNNGSNAQDDGTSNIWDDGISLGNGWSDYSGSGVYVIPGSAESVDRFPTLIEF